MFCPAGVVDEDYRGNVGVVLFNFGKETFEGELWHQQNNPQLLFLFFFFKIKLNGISRSHMLVVTGSLNVKPNMVLWDLFACFLLIP